MLFLKCLSLLMLELNPKVIFKHHEFLGMVLKHEVSLEENKMKGTESCLDNHAKKALWYFQKERKDLFPTRTFCSLCLKSQSD